MPKSANKQTKMEQSSDDEEDTLEMERNFALITKKSTTQTSAEDEEEMTDEDASVEEDEAPEEDDDNDVDDDDDDDDEDEDEADSNPEDEGGSTRVQSNMEGKLNKQLTGMSFEEIMKLQNKVGIKSYNKMAYGATKPQKKSEPMTQLNKHKPQEIPAKKHVPFLRKVVPVKKRISRDPRFDDLSGEYKPEIFFKTYKFINELREKEKEMVEKKLKKIKSETKKAKLKDLIKRMENQEMARQRQEQKIEKEIQFKRKQRELVSQGHKPFYLKKSDKKKLELAEKYSVLKKSGKLENFLSKKRKRNAAKDRRKLPSQHKQHHTWSNRGSSVAP